MADEQTDVISAKNPRSFFGCCGSVNSIFSLDFLTSIPSQDLVLSHNQLGPCHHLDDLVRPESDSPRVMTSAGFSLLLQLNHWEGLVCSWISVTRCATNGTNLVTELFIQFSATSESVQKATVACWEKRDLLRVAYKPHRDGACQQLQAWKRYHFKRSKSALADQESREARFVWRVHSYVNASTVCSRTRICEDVQLK